MEIRTEQKWKPVGFNRKTDWVVSTRTLPLKPCLLFSAPVCRLQSFLHTPEETGTSFPLNSLRLFVCFLLCCKVYCPLPESWLLVQESTKPLILDVLRLHHRQFPLLLGTVLTADAANKVSASGLFCWFSAGCTAEVLFWCIFLYNVLSKFFCFLI